MAQLRHEDSIVGISLDLSKVATGWAKWVDGHLVRTGTVSFSNCEYVGALLLAWEEWLKREVKIDELDWVAFEDVRPINKFHSEIQFGMVGELSKRAYRAQIPLLRIASSTMKKAATGNGRANKEETVAAIAKRFVDFSISDHNIADAVGVGLAALERIREREPEPA